MESTTDNWLARNPKKTLFVFLALAVIAIVAVTEKVLEYKATTHRSGITRAIRLREYDPLLSRHLVYSDPKMTVFDSFTRKEYWLHVDRDGYVMPSKVHDHPDLTMVFLGASTTECTWVDENNRFPYLVGRLLEQETGLKVNSLNASKAGNTTIHSLDILLNKILPLRPRVVIMMHNINDLNTLLYEKTYWNRNPYRSPIVEQKPSVAYHLKEIRDMVIPYTYGGIKEMIRAVRGHKEVDEFSRVRGKDLEFDRDYLVHEFRQNLETFIAICNIRRIIPVLMTQQNRLTEQPDPAIKRGMQRMADSQGISYQDYKELYDAFNQTVRDVGRENKVVVIDLAQKVPATKEYMFDAVHLTDAGCKLAAGIINTELQPVLGILPGKKPSTR